MARRRDSFDAYDAFTRGHATLDARALRRVRSPADHRLWGMPVRVWTLVLWFAGALLVDVASFVVPASADAPVAPRLVGAGVAVAVIAVMLVLRARTPTWLIHVELVLAVAFMVWFTHSAAASIAGSLTAMMTVLVLAAYTAYTLPYLQAVCYVAVSAVAVLVALVYAGTSDTLFLPWAVLTAMSFAQVMILGAMVADLKRQVVIDPLTGLLNRAGLEYMTSGAEAHIAADEPRSILVIDLDGFKAVNDRHGHAEGDRVLKQVGVAILRVCRRDDIAVRCGGDEFILVLPHTDETSAAALARRLTREILAPCSVGIARWEPDEEIHHAIGRADRRMYLDKARRRAPETNENPPAGA